MAKHIRFRRFACILTIVLLIGMAGYAQGGTLTMSDTDYADLNHWLRFGGDEETTVDVFMIYPTVTASMESADRPYVQLDNAEMRKLSTGWLMQNQGLASESAGIYAPLYRQLNAVELDNLNSDTFASYTNATPRDDIFAAFDYYLANVNKGERPFILLGQSQGAQLVVELATTFLGSEQYEKHNRNLIAAYAIGCSVTPDQIALNPRLAFSQARDDTGTIISWNTTSPGEVESGAYTHFGTWKSGALVTNPITWTTDIAPASASENGASLLVMPDGTVEWAPAYADAVIDHERGVLLTTSVDEAQYESMSDKISKYHRCDILFYYESLQKNIGERISAFMRKASA